MMRTMIAAAYCACLFGGSAAAQTVANPYTGGTVSGDASASFMWGTSGAGVLSGAKDSASIHALNGVAAAQVNAARRGYLLPDNITIQAIGSQNIVSTTVNGNNNVVDVNAGQTSSNSGPVNNTGTVNAY